MTIDRPRPTATQPSPPHGGRRRPRRRRSAVRTLALVAVIALLAGGCTAIRTFHFGVTFGNGVYVRPYQKPTWQIVAYNDWAPAGGYFCGGDEYCTLRFLDDNLAIHWLGSNPVTDIDYFFHPSQRDDFANALDQVRGTNPQRCLMLHRNSNPIGDRHNWTSSNPGGDCQLGQLIEL